MTSERHCNRCNQETQQVYIGNEQMLDKTVMYRWLCLRCRCVNEEADEVLSRRIINALRSWDDNEENDERLKI
jgi:hypothetical protein